MKAHWTSRGNKDFLYRIVSDFIGQIEKKMERDNVPQSKIAQWLRISKGRVSQVLNNPGNVSLLTVIKLARILGMKVSVVAYEDDDPKNAQGPISSEIFQACWEKYQKPRDFWALEKASSEGIVVNYSPVFVWGKNLGTTAVNAPMEIAKISDKIYQDPQHIDMSKETKHGRS